MDNAYASLLPLEEEDSLLLWAQYPAKDPEEERELRV